MSALYYAALILLLGGTLLWTGYRGRAGVAAALFALVAVAVPLAYLDGAGLPKAASLEWRSLADSKVVAVSLDEPRAIHVWLLSEGDARPRAYTLPWQTRMAEQAQEGMRQAEKTGRGLRMRRPAAAELREGDEEAVFYPEPQAAPPPKVR